MKANFVLQHSPEEHGRSQVPHASRREMGIFQYCCHFDIQPAVGENPVDARYGIDVKVSSLVTENYAQLRLKQV